MDWEAFYMRTPAAQLPWNAGGPDADLVRLVETGRIPRGQALDLGTGPGHDAVFLMQHAFDVIAIDISRSAITLARENASHHGLFGFFQVGDIRQIPVEDGWIDFAHDRGCFHVLEPQDYAAAADEIARVLKRRGLFLIKMFAERKDLQTIFTPRFKILETRDSVFEGPAHPAAISMLMEKL